MSDLFDSVATPRAPAYGSLSPMEEHQLCMTNRPAWLAYVAPGAARKLVAAGAVAIQMAIPFMPDDYRKAIAKHLSPEEKALFRAAAGVKEAA